jgi:hypothetical protein
VPLLLPASDQSAEVRTMRLRSRVNGNYQGLAGIRMILFDKNRSSRSRSGGTRAWKIGDREAVAILMEISLDSELQTVS